jgi:predicted porin
MTPSYSYKAIALPAIALCLSSAAALAQPVSIYGLADVSAGQFQDAGGTKTRKVESGNMSTSYIGFTGSDAISDTLKAKFAIESFLRADTGQPGRFNGDAFWARAAWVGLAGDFGSTTLGRTTNQFFVSTQMFNAFGDSFGYSPSIRQVLTPSAVHPEMLAFLGDTAWSNSLLYSSHDSGGISFNLQGALGEGAAGSTGRNMGANLLYARGPFSATVAYQQVRQGVGGFTPVVQATGFDRQIATQLGVSYELGAVKLLGQFSRVKTQAAVDTESRIYGAGLIARVGPGKLLAQYGNARADFNSYEVVNKTLTLGYDYALSKRSDLYALVMNDKFTAKEAGNTFAVGLMHRF